MVCINNTKFGDFSTDDLTIGRLYGVIGDVDRYGTLRIIDDSGEDYLYPTTLFEPGDILDRVRRKIAPRLHNRTT